MFHLAPTRRRELGISDGDLREAFRADLAAGEGSRREYVDLELRRLDLADLLVERDDVGPISFRDVTVTDAIDLSGSVVRQPLAFEDCRIGRLDASDATVERDLDVEDCSFGAATDAPTPLQFRRTTVEESLRVHRSRVDGSVEFAGCRVAGWLDVDGVTVSGDAHFPRARLDTAQFLATTIGGDAEFRGVTADHLAVERIVVESQIDLSETSLETLRVDPAPGTVCNLQEAIVSAGRLDQPDEGAALYDLVDAVVGDVHVACQADTLDRYRFYRTRFDGFPFASYRAVLRTNRWRLHEYAGDARADDDVEGLEQTYLEARQGASNAGDSETASAFFVRELRYRRRRYAAHARMSEYDRAHRAGAAVGWLTNGFLDVVAGYGERPQRTLVVALAVIVGSAIAYPATGGLAAGDAVVSYASHGPAAAVDGLYFSVVTFATLGLGDVHPVGTVGRFVAASEGLAGAFLTAVFVFSLGRRVTR